MRILEKQMKSFHFTQMESETINDHTYFYLMLFQLISECGIKIKVKNIYFWNGKKANRISFGVPNTNFCVLNRNELCFPNDLRPKVWNTLSVFFLRSWWSLQKVSATTAAATNDIAQCAYLPYLFIHSFFFFSTAVFVCACIIDAPNKQPEEIRFVYEDIHFDGHKIVFDARESRRPLIWGFHAIG